MDVRQAIEAAVADLEPGGRITDVCELAGGTSTYVCRADLASPTNERRRLVFRQHRSAHVEGHRRGVAAVEFGVLKALREHGLEVPEPLYLNDSGDLTDPFLITEWIEGSTEVSERQLPSALGQMAYFLARLHDLEPQELGVRDLGQLEDPSSALARYLPLDEPGEHVRSALVAGEIGRVPNRPVLVHGDYWPGNVLWKQGRLAAVIDWEDAHIGDPLADLACARVELSCQYGTEAMEQFTTQYLRMSEQLHRPLRQDSLPLWEVYVSAAALATMADWGLDPSDEVRRRRTTKRFFDRAAADLVG